MQYPLNVRFVDSFRSAILKHIKLVVLSYELSVHSYELAVIGWVTVQSV